MTKDYRNPNSIKYININYSLHRIYKHPISFYAYYKGKPILISSKKDGYVNPRNYPEEFILKMKKKLNNDWNLWKFEKDILTIKGELILNHSTPWKVHKNKIKNYKFNKSQFLYDFNYDNLEDSRS